MSKRPTKEQAPPDAGSLHEVSGGAKRDPDRHYHYFGTDKVTREFEREGHAKDLGYDQEHSRNSRQVLMSCHKDAHLARRRAAQEKDAKRRKDAIEENVSFSEPGAASAIKKGAASGYEVGKIDD